MNPITRILKNLESKSSTRDAKKHKMLRLIGTVRVSIHLFEMELTLPSHSHLTPMYVIDLEIQATSGGNLGTECMVET